MAAFRWRFLALWISQAAHLAGTYGLRVFVVLRLGLDGTVAFASAWHLVTALFLLPSVFLVPLYGAVGNSLPKTRVLRAVAAYGLVVALFFAWFDRAWLVCVVLVALGSASYLPTRYALLPAAAQDTGWPLGRIVGLIETGAVLAIVAGMLAGGAGADRMLELGPGIHASMVWVAGCFLVCWAAMLAVDFASDVWRPEAAGAALRGFLQDALHLWRNGPCRSTLLAVAYLRAVVTAGAGAFLAVSLRDSATPPLDVLLSVALFSMGGTAAGSFLAAVLGKGRSSALQVPAGALGLTLSMAGVALLPNAPLPACFAAGLFGGLINVPLLAAFQESVPAGMRGNAMALLNTAGLIAMTFVSLALAALAGAGVLSPLGQFWLVAGLAAAGTAAALVPLLPPARPLYLQPAQKKSPE